jgi:glycosyltransferase involved in cell wall biosynthesis
LVGSDVLMAGRLLRAVNRRVLSSASRVFANGEYLATKAAEQVPRARVLPLLIGVDLPSLKRTNFPPGPTRFICTRGFLDVYNNAAIIHAIARLPHDCPDFRMVFVSDGPLLDRHIELADRMLSPPLRARVEFWGGVSYRRLLDALSESHVFLSMSRSDGTATSILEAMGAGLFPILSDIPQNHALIGPQDRNGILVPLDDHDRLASAMIWAMGNVDVCARFSDRNREVIEQKADAARNRRILAEQLEAFVACDRGGTK